MAENKNITVLARRDHTEAMRVAAGLTIMDHKVRLIFMTAAVAETPENAEQAELLDLCDIVAETTVVAMAGELSHLDAAALAAAIAEAGCVINL